MIREEDGNDFCRIGHLEKSTVTVTATRNGTIRQNNLLLIVAVVVVQVVVALLLRVFHGKMM